MKIWLGAMEAPAGFIKDTPVHGMSVLDSAEWLSLQNDVDDPHLTGYDCLEVMRNAASYPSQVLAFHDPDTSVRSSMIAKAKELFGTNVVKFMESSDGGQSFHDV